MTIILIIIIGVLLLVLKDKIFGDDKYIVKEWEFPENLSQYNMISEIEDFLSAFSR